MNPEQIVKHPWTSDEPEKSPSILALVVLAPLWFPVFVYAAVTEFYKEITGR